MGLLESPAEIRAGGAIHGLIGANGSGKSLVTAGDTMLDLQAGYPVLSTMRFLDFDNPRPCDDLGCDCDKNDAGRHLAAHPNYTSFVSWDQFMDLRDGVVVADEVNGVGGSVDHTNLPKRVAKKLHEMRRFDIVYRWTAPAWARADLRVREVTTMVTVCVGMWKKPSQDGRRRHRQSRLVKAVTYDVQEVVDFNVQGRQNFDPVCKQFIRVLHYPGRLAYDTFAPVTMVGRGSDYGGRCDHCNLPVQRKYCKGHPELEEADAEPDARELASVREAGGGPDGSGAPISLAVVDQDGGDHAPRRLVPIAELKGDLPPAINGGRQGRLT